MSSTKNRQKRCARDRGDALGRLLARFLVLSFVLVGLCATGVRADTPATSEAEPQWAPMVATTTGKSAWLKFTTGEWIKGSVDRIQDDTVYFDSDQFGDIQVDWDDVAELRMPETHTYRFTDRRILKGQGEVKGDVVLVRAGDSVRQFDRKDFVSMISGTGRELDYCSLNVSVGL